MNVSLKESVRLEDVFEPGLAADMYREKIRPGSIRGIDRVDTYSFDKRLDREIAELCERCIEGTYRFSPYLELLRSKGRESYPRVISIPVVRDRVVLLLLKELLHQAFPEAVHRTIPNAHIRQLKRCLNVSGADGLAYIRLDIKNFYGSLDHETLRGELRRRLGFGSAVSLLMRAVRNPTVSAGTRRTAQTRAPNRLGVPQGLAISNILADIYASPLDAVLAPLATDYHRYVDDILLLCPTDELSKAHAAVEEALELLGLVKHPQKSTEGLASGVFKFLGYRFSWPLVSIRDASVDRFVSSVAARFTAFQRGQLAFIRQHRWLDHDVSKQVFLEDLNERITGAFAGGRRYGWLFYFAEITDTGLLHRLDRVVAGFFDRLATFNGRPPSGLKTLSRTWREMARGPQSPYIADYSRLDGLAERIEFLERRGIVDPSAVPDADEVNRIFEREMRKRLSRLEADVGVIS